MEDPSGDETRKSDTINMSQEARPYKTITHDHAVLVVYCSN
jgi:hypothetical protein